MADLIKIFGKGFSDRNAKFEKSRLYGFSVIGVTEFEFEPNN